MVNDNCVFIKTKNTGSGHVEVHVATADTGFQQSGGDWPSWFGVADADNGTWMMADMNGDGRPDLVFIKTKNTGSGHVEVHVATADTGFQQSGGDWPSWFGVADADNGTWMMADMNGDGRPDLVFIKTKNTGSGHVEVHVATADTGFQQSGGDWPSWFGVADADNGTWMMADMNGDGRPDLVFIKTKNTGSGHVEVHVATADTGFQQSGGDWPSWFGVADADNGTWMMADMNGDGRPDLVFIKTKNTGSGHVEVHVATADTGFQQSGGDWPSWFGVADNGTWTMAPSTLIIGSVQADDGSTISWITEGSTVVARGTQGRQMILKQTTGPSDAAEMLTVFSDAGGRYLSVARSVNPGQSSCTVDLKTPSAEATVSAANCFSTARELSLSARSGSGLIIRQATAPVAWNSSIKRADFTRAFRLFGPTSPQRARSCWHATNSSTTLPDSASRPRRLQNSTTASQHLP